MLNTKKLVLIAGAIILVCGAIYTISIPKKSITKNDNVNQISNKEEIYNNLQTKTEMQYVKFDTADEMFEYTEGLSKINNLEEATSFIENFFSVCNLGEADTMLTYFDSSIWDIILDGNMFPFYDETNTVSFKAENIEVTETKEENMYEIKYTVIATETSTGEVIAELQRKDKMTLKKDFGTITITHYERNTTKSKYY